MAFDGVLPTLKPPALPGRLDFLTPWHGRAPRNASWTDSPLRDRRSRRLWETGMAGSLSGPVVAIRSGRIVSIVTVRQDYKQNVFPRKERDENLIDGYVALIMAMGIALQYEADRLNNPPDRSIYEDRGLLSLG